MIQSQEIIDDQFAVETAEDSVTARTSYLISWDLIPQESVLERTPLDLFELSAEHGKQLVAWLETLPIEMISDVPAPCRHLLESLNLLSVSSCTISWLLAHCGETLLSAFLDELSRIIRELTNQEPHIRKNLFSPIPFVSEQLLFYLIEYPPPFSNGLMMIMKLECRDNELMTSLSETTIFDRRGFIPESIRDVALFYTLTKQHEGAVRVISGNFYSPANCSSFVGYIGAWLDAHLSVSESRILLQHEGWIDPPVKVPEIARKMSCTSQNVYRLMHLAEQKLSATKPIAQLQGLALAVFIELYKAGGILASSDLCVALTDRYGWSDKPSGNGVSCIMVRSKVKGIIYKNDWVALTSRACLSPSAKANAKWTYFDREITPDKASQLLCPPGIPQKFVLESPEPPPEEITTPLLPEKDGESIFQQDWVTNGNFAWLVAGAILSLADQRQFLGPKKVWSIAELHLSIQDYTCLRTWGHTESFSSQNLTKRCRVGTFTFSGREALALLFIVYATEVGRRNATEGEMWPAVAETLGRGLRDFLMLTQGLDNASPRPWLKTEMERTFRNYNLRHAFDSAGTHAYIRSIYLQFGFTQNGLQRLPWWLCGQQIPVAVEELKGDGPNRSPLFDELWQSFKEFRWKRIPLEEFRQKLLGNPWLPPSGIDVVLRAVTAKSYLLPQGEDAQVVEDNASASLLGAPRLAIVDGQPAFHVPLGDIWPESLQEPSYVLVLDSLNRVSVTRQSDGSYAFPDGDITISPVKPALDVILLASGQPVLDEPICYYLWNEEEEFTFYKSNGWKVSEERVRADKTPLYLICAADIELSTPADVLYSLFMDSARLHYFKNGMPTGFTLSLDGEPIWRVPELSETKKKPGTAPVTIQAICMPIPCKWGEKAKIRLSGIPSGVKPRRLLIGDIRLSMDNGGETAESERFVVPPGMMALPLKGTLIGLDHGDLRRFSVSIFSKFSGVAVDSAAGWVLPDSRKLLDKADLHTARVLALPSDSLLNEWAYTEGERFLARPSRYGDRIGQELVGLGAPLFFRKGPYNCVETPIEISRGVVDGGVMGAAERTEQGWRIALRHDLELSDEFDVHAWYPEEPLPIQIQKSQWRHDPDTRSLLVTPLPDSYDDPCSYSLSFSQKCVGRTWCGGSAFYDMATIVSDAPHWNETAAWLAWWHVPVLSREIRPAVAERISSQTVETLMAWMGLAHGTATSPCMTDVTLRMKDAIRTFFHDDLPEKAKSAEVLQALEMLTGDWDLDEDGAWEHYDNLLEISPILLTHLATTGTAALYGSKPARVEWLLQLLRRRIAGVSELDPVSEITVVENDLLATASRVMAVDEQFIKRSILEEARKFLKSERPPVRNLEYCLDIQPVRDWLALRLLA